VKKVLKIIGIVLLSIIGIYTLFVVEESIRLSNNVDAKPLIVVMKSDVNKNIENDVVYNSIGFKLINTYGTSLEDNKDVLLGQEFWLFDTFMLWGWIS
jgi:hypothetical protein